MHYPKCSNLTYLTSSVKHAFALGAMLACVISQHRVMTHDQLPDFVMRSKTLCIKQKVFPKIISMVHTLYDIVNILLRLLSSLYTSAFYN